MSPQQQIFLECYKVSTALGYRTVDYLPAKDYGYPFVYIGEQFDVDRATKSVIYGNVTQRIHLYHEQRKRGDLTTMMDKLKRELRKITRTKGFYVTVKNINAQTLLDTSTAQTLWHGIIEVEFKFN